MKKYLLLLPFLYLACSTSEKEEPAESTDSPEDVVTEEPVDSLDTLASAETDQSPASSLRVYLNCRMVIEDDIETDTLFIVSLVAKDQNILIDTVAFCQPISGNEYARYDIPEQAVDACGGWHEEAGEYFYIIEDGLDLVVHHAWLKEEQTTNSYPYREVYRLKLPDLDL